MTVTAPAFLAGLAIAVAAADPPTPLVPPSWAALKNSAAVEDRVLVMQIERMAWQDACSTWGRAHLLGRLSSAKDRADIRKDDRLLGAKDSAYADARIKAGLSLFLESEGLLNARDRAYAEKFEIRVGMSECAVLAGRPSLVTSAHRTVTRQGIRTQYVYGERVYIYTETLPGERAGVVTSVQY